MEPPNLEIENTKQSKSYPQSIYWSYPLPLTSKHMKTYDSTFWALSNMIQFVRHSFFAKLIIQYNSLYIYKLYFLKTIIILLG